MICNRANLDTVANIIRRMLKNHGEVSIDMLKHIVSVQDGICSMGKNRQEMIIEKVIEWMSQSEIVCDGTKITKPNRHGGEKCQASSRPILAK